MSTASSRSPLVIAHRGASAARPENTVDAFRHAAELGADWVELDVRRTADDALVVRHDAQLGDGRVIAALRRAELPEAVPTLDDALDACAGLGVNVEIKAEPEDPDAEPAGASIAAAVGARLEARIAQAGAGEAPHRGDQLLVSSFDGEVLAQVRALHPTLRCAALILRVGRLERLMGELVAQGMVAVNPWDALVDTALVEAAQAAGLAVNVWTVDDPERMRQLVALGVDGIITNVPDVARAVVDSAR